MFFFKFNVTLRVAMIASLSDKCLMIADVIVFSIAFSDCSLSSLNALAKAIGITSPTAFVTATDRSADVISTCTSALSSFFDTSSSFSNLKFFVMALSIAFASASSVFSFSLLNSLSLSTKVRAFSTSPFCIAVKNSSVVSFGFAHPAKTPTVNPTTITNSNNFFIFCTLILLLSFLVSQHYIIV
ncbi:hypothetical protein protein [Bacillus cereus G9241]|nr:hypothetical protein protein [Bacillus cereus G9241]